MSVNVRTVYEYYALWTTSRRQYERYSCYEEQSFGENRKLILNLENVYNYKYVIWH
jgi:hypothetical protein